MESTYKNVMPCLIYATINCMLSTTCISSVIMVSGYIPSGSFFDVVDQTL